MKSHNLEFEESGVCAFERAGRNGLLVVVCENTRCVDSQGFYKVFEHTDVEGMRWSKPLFQIVLLNVLAHTSAYAKMSHHILDSPISCLLTR